MDIDFINTPWFKMMVALAAIVVFSFATRRMKRRSETSENPEALQAGMTVLGEAYRLFSDVLVPTQYGMSRIDHLIVSPHGIFVVTVKKQAGKVEGRTGDSEWMQKSSGQRVTFANPLWENRKQMNNLEAHLGNYHYIPVVVFSRARLKGNFAANVVTAHKLFDFIRKHDRLVLNSEQLKSIVEKLEKKLEDG